MSELQSLNLPHATQACEHAEAAFRARKQREYDPLRHIKIP